MKHVWRPKQQLGNSLCVVGFLLLSGCINLDKSSSTTVQMMPASARFADTVEGAIITVPQWGGTPLEPIAIAQARKHVITHITLHHQGETFVRGRDPQQYLRNLQTWSRRTRKWLDIPYHYIIDLDGKIYAGRDIQYAGDTNTEYDPTGHALIEVVGNFEEVEPNPAQLNAVVNVMTMLSVKHRVKPDKIAGHKDVSGQTVCPGKYLYRYLANGYFQNEVRKNLP